MTATSTYLHTVFGDTEGVAHIAVGTGGHFTESGRYEFAAGGWTQHTFQWPAESDALERAITQETAAGSDVYLCPYVLHGSKRAQGAAVERRIVHADLDHGHLDLDAVKALGGFAVASGTPGNGHVYVALDRPVTAAHHMVLCKALGAHLGGADSKISDNDVLRPPGTVNGKHQTAVEWAVEPTGVVWAPDELAGALGVSLSVVEAPVGPVGAAEPYDVAQAPQRVRDALANVTDDRSADTMRVVGACHDAGLTLGQARTVIADRLDLAERLAERGDDDVLTCWLKVTDDRTVRAAEHRRENELVAELVGSAGVADATPESEDAAAAVGSSWGAVDLAETVAGVLSGTITRPAPTVGRRADGQALFYRGKVNGVAGSSNAGKSWTGFHTCAQELACGEHVVYVDLEDDMAAAVARLLDLGVDPAVIPQRFHYIAPDEMFTAEAAVHLFALIDQVGPSVVVIDSTGESLALDGARPNDDDEVARWFRRLPTAVARRSDAAVVVLDHITKAEDGGLWPIGSQRKRAAIGGAQYMQINVRPFDRTTPGFSKLVCAKDRHGHYHQGQTVALLHVTPGPSGVALELGTPQETGSSGVGTWRPTGIMEKVSRLLEAAGEPLSGKQIRDEAGVKKGPGLELAKRELIGGGYVTAEPGPRNATLHTLVRPYRQDTDPESETFRGEGAGHGSNLPQTTCRPAPALRTGAGGQVNSHAPEAMSGHVGATGATGEKSPPDDPTVCPTCGGRRGQRSVELDLPCLACRGAA